MCGEGVERERKVVCFWFEKLWGSAPFYTFRCGELLQIQLLQELVAAPRSCGLYKDQDIPTKILGKILGHVPIS